jgi:hypothetical protein
MKAICTEKYWKLKNKELNFSSFFAPTEWYILFCASLSLLQISSMPKGSWSNYGFIQMFANYEPMYADKND